MSVEMHSAVLLPRPYPSGVVRHVDIATAIAGAERMLRSCRPIERRQGRVEGPSFIDIVIADDEMLAPLEAVEQRPDAFGVQTEVKPEIAQVVDNVVVTDDRVPAPGTYR
jgi:hypothetical protein